MRSSRAERRQGGDDAQPGLGVDDRVELDVSHGCGPSRRRAPTSIPPPPGERHHQVRAGEPREGRGGPDQHHPGAEHVHRRSPATAPHPRGRAGRPPGRRSRWPRARSPRRTLRPARGRDDHALREEADRPRPPVHRALASAAAPGCRACGRDVHDRHDERDDPGRDGDRAAERRGESSSSAVSHSAPYPTSQTAPQRPNSRALDGRASAARPAARR